MFWSREGVESILLVVLSFPLKLGWGVRLSLRGKVVMQKDQEVCGLVVDSSFDFLSR